jgi:hypothetical protein
MQVHHTSRLSRDNQPRFNSRLGESTLQLIEQSTEWSTKGPTGWLTRHSSNQAIRTKQSTSVQNKAKIEQFVIGPQQSVWTSSYSHQRSWLPLSAI